MNKIFAVLGGVGALWFGRDLLLPIITAVFLWYLTIAIGSYYRRILKIGWLSNAAAGASLLGVVWGFIELIRPMLWDLYKQAPQIAEGGKHLIAELSEIVGTEISFAGLPTLQESIMAAGNSLASGGAVLAMIIIYMIFIFIEQGSFPKKLRALFPQNKQFGKASFILHAIDSQMKKYLGVKTFVSLLQGFAFYLCLAVIGVPFAALWGFGQFLLNYIPTFGSIAATTLPMLYSFAINGDITDVILIGISGAIVNLIFGNILDPKLTGKSLNLSPLAILVSLIFWGMLWGSLGMFFSVPILVGIYVAAAQFECTRWIAVLLSADGQIPDKNEE
ncbi:MAG: AI-2E family transporter [Rickettsiales bacterium]|jgi:predicted PurR-regulated permease PerM|nr:AI-2E family transporter [Rickettsiales bacterium]